MKWMTKLLIADDEPEVIEGISTLVDWESNGIKIVGCATNGEELECFALTLF